MVDLYGLLDVQLPLLPLSSLHLSFTQLGDLQGERDTCI